MMMRDRAAAWILVASAALYLAAGFLWGTTSDEEEYRFTILSTLLHARALADGSWPIWTSELGLGMPHPLGQSFVAHPLMPLLLWMRVDHWVAVFLALHVAAGAAGVLWLGRILGLSAIPRASAAATFLLAAALQNFLLTDFWPSAAMVWTLMPWLLGLIVVARDSQSRPSSLRASVGIGLIAALIVSCGHPGYALNYALPTLAFAAARVRPFVRAFRWWGLAAVVMIAAASPMLLHVGPEVTRFELALPRFSSDAPLQWAGLWDLFVRPLTFGGEEPWSQAVLRRGTRVAFFGPPFAWLAVGAIITGLAVRRARIDLILGFVVSAVLIATPGLGALKVLPATWLFRDPLALFGLLLAALVIQELLARGRRRTALVLVGLQVAFLCTAAWPFLRLTVDPNRRQPARVFAEPGAAIRWLSAQTAQFPGRIYYSASVDRLMESGGLIDAGVWRNTPAYHGLRVINGTFKGISANGISPDISLPYGHIGAVPQPQTSEGTLGVLGARYVLALRGEPVDRGLRHVGEFDTAGAGLVLYEHPGTNGAFVVDPAVDVVEPRWFPDCRHRALLCRDQSALWKARDLLSDVRRSDSHGVIEVWLKPVPAARLLVVSEMYREGWTATVNGARVAPYSVAGGLIGVGLPPNAETVRLSYDVPKRRVATVAWLLISLIGIAVVASPWKGSRV